MSEGRSSTETLSSLRGASPVQTELLLPHRFGPSPPGHKYRRPHAKAKAKIWCSFCVVGGLLVAVVGFVFFKRNGLPYPPWVPPGVDLWQEAKSTGSGDEYPPARYLVRDWSPWLGWNNQRYILEMSLNYAHMLNRTLVLPPFAGAQYCEFPDNVCTASAPRPDQKPSNLSYPDEFPSGEPGNNPLDSWVLPLEWFLDLDVLKKSDASVITWSEYRKRHHLAPSLGHDRGGFFPEDVGNLSYRRIEHERFQESQKVLVDWVPQYTDSDFPIENEEKAECDRALEGYTLGPGDAQTVEDAPSAVRGLSEGCLASHGFAKVYTYASFTVHAKAPIDPTPKLARIEDLNGMGDYLSQFNETVLHILGEMHWPQLSGGLYFTTLGALEQNTNRILAHVRPPNEYFAQAERLIERLQERCGGRAFRAAHMRRGDMIDLEWIKLDIEKHYIKLKEKLDRGTVILAHRRDLQEGAGLNASTIPRTEDPIYLATNERDPDKLKYLRSMNVVLLSDLITPADRREFGARALWTDLLLELSQIVMSRSAFFHGEGWSSVDGWVIAMRLGRGIPRPLSELEYSN